MDWSDWLALCAELDASGCSHAERVGRAELLLLASARRHATVPAWVWLALVGLLGLLIGTVLPVTI